MFEILPGKLRVMLCVLLGGMVVKAVLETAAMALVAFYAATLSRPGDVANASLAVKRILGFFAQFHGIPGENSYIFSLSILIVMVIIAKNAFKGYITYMVGRYSAKLEAFLGESLISGFLTMPYSWYVNNNSADLIYAIEVRKLVGRHFINCLIKLTSDFLLILIMIAGLLVMQPLVSLLVLVGLGGSGGLIYLNIRKIIDNSAKKCQRYEQQINRDCTKAIHGIKDVKIFAQETSFILESRDNLNQFSKYFGRYKFFELSPSVILESVGFMMLTGSICLMLFCLNVSAANVTATIALLAVAAWKCLPAMERILAGSAEIRYSLPFLSTVFSYFDEMKHYMPNATEHHHISFTREIRIKRLSFRYPKNEKYIFTDLSFQIKKGKTIGIIGTSGAGKSTLVDLLTGLLAPTNGKIWIDDTPLGPETAYDWRKKIGYVSQFPYIYDGTVAENVAFGLKGENIDRSRVSACCQMAYMANFLTTLPQGIDTEIGERGIRLSGGQLQRVAIARALYNDPEIMIFDEATSSLDTKSEQGIKQTMYSLKDKKTLIIIAHRLTTIEDCDQVLWIEDGKVKLSGTPMEIIPLYTETDHSPGN